MGVIEDVASIKHELEEVKKENKEENKKIQELSRFTHHKKWTHNLTIMTNYVIF